MTAVDRATQAEIRIATLYAIHLDTERILEDARRLDDAYVPKMEAAWARKDRFLNALTDAVAELDLDLGLIFEVAKEIRAESGDAS